ncbi:mitochondrial carrier superfamily protein [Cardiosporidium cionae]|uniref:Mitochondrial carrier superfamily protein n=1 Tax=Cardiosporidium cionae TaxID=476202 RepID=A0ABQ7J5R3_9APIC|nr:mitochondrial carrier superfamily protein [Cardiosporidium cionae]|eukprot:KAF8819327.1 mitochondrial carrier superfamily protein [Cardiosporidium cionae]
MMEPHDSSHKLDLPESACSRVEEQTSQMNALETSSQVNDEPMPRHGLPHSATLYSSDFHALLARAQPIASSSEQITREIEPAEKKDIGAVDHTYRSYPTARGVQPAEAARMAALSYAQHNRRATIFSRSMVGTLSATVAALVATIIVYPLDNVRTRITINPHRNRFSSFQLIRRIFTEEGGRGLYRGLPSALSGVLISWIVNYISFSVLKMFFIKRERPRHNSLTGYIARVGASFLSVLLSSPIWLINTRIIMNGYGSSSHNIFCLLRKVYEEEGLQGLFADLIPSQFVNAVSSIQSAIISKLQRFMIYIKMIKRDFVGDPKIEVTSSSADIVFPHPFPASHNFNRVEIYPSEYFIIGLLSRMLASFLTQPFRVMKARSQYRGSAPAETAASPYIAEILEKEGIRGFFKGATTKLLGDVISTVVMIFVYIRVLDILTNVFLKNPRKLSPSKR